MTCDEAPRNGRRDKVASRRDKSHGEKYSAKHIRLATALRRTDPTQVVPERCGKLRSKKT